MLATGIRGSPESLDCFKITFGIHAPVSLLHFEALAPSKKWKRLVNPLCSGLPQWKGKILMVSVDISSLGVEGLVFEGVRGEGVHQHQPNLHFENRVQEQKCRLGLWPDVLLHFERESVEANSYIGQTTQFASTVQTRKCRSKFANWPDHPVCFYSSKEKV